MAQGDQIYVYRELFNLQGIYEHHGIDCGDGSVIHYRKPSEIIEKTSLETFARGNPIYIRRYIDGFCFIADVVVSRAQSRLGERKYNLIFNNCEHFATWCKTGISDSKQIRDFIPIATQLNTFKLYEPLTEALQESDPNNAQQLLKEALAGVKVVWDDLQPQYKTTLKEVNSWDKVAKEALKQNREDLAREAIKRKLNFKRRADKLQEQLQQLATMTETLLRSSQSVG
jgi:Lecithin retinol acyltransferase/PspA/IM30 family